MCQCNKSFKKSIRARINDYKKRSKKTNEFIIFYVNENNDLQVRKVEQGYTPNQVAELNEWSDWTNILEYEHT